MDFIEQTCAQLREFLPDFPTFSDPVSLVAFFRDDFGRVVDSLAPTVTERPYAAEVYAADDVVVEPYTLFSGRVVLAPGVRIGPFCFIRGPVYVGRGTRVGSYNEIQRSIVLDQCELSHRNFVSDSVVGNRCHFGGQIVTTPKSTRGDITAHYRGDKYPASWRFGATVEDGTDLNLYCTTMPGTYLAPGTFLLGPAVLHGDGHVIVTKR